MEQTPTMQFPFPPDYLLLDGAVIAGTSVLDELAQGVVRAGLYAEEGDEAAAVGPWLVAADAQSIAITSPLLQTSKHRAGLGLLKSSASFEQVLAHLSAARFLRARRRRFYLRYSDLRAFDNLWQVLRQEQQAALLGPIDQWLGWPWGEHATQYAMSGSGNAVESLPLSLTSAQYARLARLQRDDERLAECIALEPEIASDRDMPSLRDISRRTGQWLQSTGSDAYAVAVVVGIQALRTGGAILESQEFRHAVMTTITDNSDPADLLMWPDAFNNSPNMGQRLE